MDESKSAHPVDVAVGARVKATCVAQRMSQSELAERIGMTFQQIQKYERGANRISASRLVEIARVLKVEAGSFFADLGDAEAVVDHRMLSKPGAVELLLAYNHLTAREQKALLHLARDLAGQDG